MISNIQYHSIRKKTFKSPAVCIAFGLFFFSKTIFFLYFLNFENNWLEILLILHFSFAFVSLFSEGPFLISIYINQRSIYLSIYIYQLSIYLSIFFFTFFPILDLKDHAASSRVWGTSKFYFTMLFYFS